MHTNSSAIFDNIDYHRNLIICCYKCEKVIVDCDRQLSRYSRENSRKRIVSDPKYLCHDCDGKNKNERIEIFKNGIKKKEDFWKFKIVCICFVIIAAVSCYNFVLFKKALPDTSDVELKNLKLQFPSQKNETWHNILSVIEKGMTSVKSIVLLHGEDSEDRKTLNCLVRDLVLLYTGNRNIAIKDITFKSDLKVIDYGEILVTYIQKVKEHGILVVNNINHVPGHVAKVFHFLCDEISSEIKPSLFIFSLQYKENAEKLKPITTAATILRNAWSELPVKDLDPLLSRIVKNVVVIMPEKKTC